MKRGGSLVKSDLVGNIGPGSLLRYVRGRLWDGEEHGHWTRDGPEEQSAWKKSWNQGMGARLGQTTAWTVSRV